MESDDVDVSALGRLLCSMEYAIMSLVDARPRKPYCWMPLLSVNSLISTSEKPATKCTIQLPTWYVWFAFTVSI